MKVAQVLGRGVEGAGITRYVIELAAYLKKSGIDFKVYVVDDKKWGRGKFQNMPDYEYITKDNIDTFADDVLNKFDYVFIHSVPSTKHSQWAQDGFLKIMKDLKTKKIIFQNDHKIASIHRNANFFEICQLCDGIVSFSATSPFFNKLVQLFGEDIRDRYIPLINGFNFDNLVQYRKKEHYKKITYLGRFATFKQPERLFAFLPYAKENNLHLEMKGVERSLGALHIFYDDIGKKIRKHDIIEVNKKSIENGILPADHKDRSLEHIYIWGPYEYEDGMETLSSSLVGADFYHLNADAYGNSIEYAMCEIIGVGCVPMFDYHWAENTWVFEKGKQTDKKYIDLDTYGLFLKKDLSNVKELVEKINDIYSNKALHKKYLDCSLEVTRNHCDINYIYADLIENIAKVEKAKIVKPKSLF